MSGMIAQATDRRRWLNQMYYRNIDEASADNNAADEIIAMPDRHLLSQAQLFEVEGGWSTFALTVGLGLFGAAAVLGTNARLSTYPGRGNLRFYEWLSLGSATFLGGFVGQNVGISTFGDRNRYNAHWMAYTFVKTQNRFEGRDILCNAPFYY